MRQRQWKNARTRAFLSTASLSLLTILVWSVVTYYSTWMRREAILPFHPSLLSTLNAYINLTPNQSPSMRLQRMRQPFVRCCSMNQRGLTQLALAIPQPIWMRVVHIVLRILIKAQIVIMGHRACRFECIMYKVLSTEAAIKLTHVLHTYGRILVIAVRIRS